MTAALDIASPPFMLAPPLVVELPWPISTNRIWRSKIDPRTRKTIVYLSPEYAAWTREADAMAMGKRYQKVSGPFRVSMFLSAAKRRKNLDIDNRIKVCLDWLQRVELIDNDSLAQEVRAAWCPRTTGCRVEVERVG